MRKALNENPQVQMIVFGIVGIAVVFILFTMVLKKDPAPATGTPAAAVPAATDPAAAGATTTPATGATTTPATATATTPATGTATTPATGTPTGTVPETPVAPATGVATDPNGLLPTKGLPKNVLVAYAKNQAIALLVVDPKGLSDSKVKAFTQPLKARKDVSVFVVNAKDIGDYYRITSGVSVDRVPALVVITPRKLNVAAPTATVSYGFRGPKSVDQAVDDALYKGGTVPSYP